MPDYLKVTIPLDIGEINDIGTLQKDISKTIMDNQKEFLPLMERLIEMGDARMTVVDDSLNIDASDVAVDSSGGVASGMFDSNYYAGCKDMDSTSDHEVTLPFTINDHNLIFEIELPPAWIPEYY